jgi:TRAP-type C4-dicarboxylate transport system permease large subunit
MLREVCRRNCAHYRARDGDPGGRVLLNVVIQTIRAHAAARPLDPEYQLRPCGVLGAVILLYLILGTFMEELSMMISTIPITTPLILQAGYDPVWFGILLVLLIQTAMISPPFGINIFVIHGLRGRGTLSDVEIGSAPFVIALLAMIALICVYPEIVMWAPRVFG